MYTLKQIPEDFIVREISSIKVQDTGKYVYFQLKKKNTNTLDAIKLLARIFNIPEKNIGFAGSKDKKAITTQICSIQGISKERLLGLNIKDIQLEFLGYGNTSISLGDLESNQFEIVIRNLDHEKINKIKAIINYFDEQRFSENNVQIGKHIIKKEFKQAVELIDEEACNRYLQEKAHDYIGALKQLPIRLLRLYVNAYQSYIWNETIKQYLGTGRKVNYSNGELIFRDNCEQFLNQEIPIIGFEGLEDYNNEIIKNIIAKIMQQENIDFDDFVIKQIPPLTLEGEMRKLAVEVKDLTIEKKEEDELNKGKKKIKISFSLSKGSYATMVVNQLID